MTVINTNVGAIQARVASLGAQTNMEKAMQRLSSGLRINSAADDAAGLAVATKMESQLRGINMAIRNSNDGISLVQTAESGMAEISNMVIRMRELAVQMNNGIYTDGDRANAQLEVTALLAEIDKIADNTAFNGVKVLDGSYSTDIRAGNTNPEVIGVTINRMNTDALGGVAITSETEAAVDLSPVYAHSRAKTHLSADEGQITIGKEQLHSEFQEFAIANSGGTYSIEAKGDGALFQVDSSGLISIKAGELDFDNRQDLNVDGVYEFTVAYTAADGSQVTEDILLTVTNKDVVTASATTGSVNITASEAEVVTINTVGLTGVMSDAFREFVASDTAKTGSGFQALTGTDAGDFTINTTSGVITSVTGALDFENAADSNTDNVYTFSVEYRHSNGKSFTENVTLTVTDNATADLGSLKLTEEIATKGKSSISIELDSNNAAHAIFTFDDAPSQRDLLSQGAKDFIAKYGESTISAATIDLTDTQFSSAATVVDNRVQGGAATAEVNTFVLTDPVDNAGNAGATLAASNTLVFTDGTNSTTITLTATDVASQANFLAAINNHNTQGVPYTLSASTTNTNDVTITLTSDNPGSGTSGGNAALSLGGGAAAVSINSTAAGANPGTAGADGTAGTALINGTGASNARIVFDKESGTRDATAVVTLRDSVTGKEFQETITFNITQGGVNGAHTFVSGLGNTEQTAADTSLSGKSDGEAVVLDMRDRGNFAALRTYTDAHTGGTYTLHDITGGSTYSKATHGHASANGGVSGNRGFSIDAATGALTLDAGADAQTYNAMVKYTDLDGNVFEQQVRYTTTAAAHPAASTATQTSTSQAKDAIQSSTEITGSKSAIQVNETRKATFSSTGANSVLTGTMSTFANAYPKGTWSLTGADAESFAIDKEGNVESKVIMNFESGKTSYNFNVVYTMGDNSYEEKVTLNVVNNTADDGNHIANVDVSTQAGSAEAIDILNLALNEITASQAKLGSIQNRLQHNIDNLTSLSSQTETARGRITDADYAQETSQLSKQQILSQAATSMLAQANQSKQGVLALLQ